MAKAAKYIPLTERMRAELLSVHEAFNVGRTLAGEKPHKLSTVGHATKLHRRFARLNKPDPRMAVRTYEAYLIWASRNWPPLARWPAHVERPPLP